MDTTTTATARFEVRPHGRRKIRGHNAYRTFYGVFDTTDDDRMWHGHATHEEATQAAAACEQAARGLWHKMHAIGRPGPEDELIAYDVAFPA